MCYSSWPSLVRALVSAKERRLNLKTHNSSTMASTKRRQSCTAESVAERGGSGTAARDSGEKHDRTTRMLLAVLFLFLLTEFPQGILALLSGILGDAFFSECYGHLGELMDILALINSAINFILYCVMSRQFRQTFQRIFRPDGFLNKWTTATTVVMTEGRGNLRGSERQLVRHHSTNNAVIASSNNKDGALINQQQQQQQQLVNETALLNPDPVVV